MYFRKYSISGSGSSLFSFSLMSLQFGSWFEDRLLFLVLGRCVELYFSEVPCVALATILRLITVGLHNMRFLAYSKNQLTVYFSSAHPSIVGGLKWLTNREPMSDCANTDENFVAVVRMRASSTSATHFSASSRISSAISSALRQLESYMREL